MKNTTMTILAVDTVRHIALGLLTVVSIGAALAADSPQQRPPAASPAGVASPSALGANHPPLPPAAREGKVTVDSAAKFTHFRVGN